MQNRLLEDSLTEVEVFTASLERCLSDRSFISSFYERFLASSEDVRHKFWLTNFPDQERRLARSLRTLGRAVVGDLEALRHLSERAESHDRHHLDIGPHLYEVWRTCLMETAAEFDSEWSPVVERSWFVVLVHAIHYMTHRY